MARGATRARATAADAKEAAKTAAELAKKTLDGLFSVGKPSASWRVLVYGDNGVGKTTFLAQCPGVIILPVEDGAAQHRVPQWKEPLDSLEAFDAALAALRHSRHDFKAVAIETVPAVEELIFAAIETRLQAITEKDAPRSIAEVNEREFGAGYDLVRDEWRRILRALDELREERGMHVLLSAPTKVDTVRRPNSSDYQKHAPQFSGQKSANAVKAWCDYVLFFELEVNVAKVERRVMASAGERVMRCTRSASHDAKCRGEVAWPDSLPLVERAGWETFAATAETILEYGSSVEETLEADFCEEVAWLSGDGETKAEDRKKKARTYFDAAMKRRHFGEARDIIRTIVAETEGQKSAVLERMHSAKEAKKEEANGATGAATAVPE